VSNFYEKQKNNVSFEEWASADRGENNWMVRNLVGKSPKDQLSLQDLDHAKEVVRTKFLVGLTSKMEESIHRFNLVIGYDARDPKNQDCINEISFGKDDLENEPGSPAWMSLSKIHMYDDMLYKSIEILFAEQRILFEEFKTSKFGPEEANQPNNNYTPNIENGAITDGIDATNQEPDTDQPGSDESELSRRLQPQFPTLDEQTSQHMSSGDSARKENKQDFDSNESFLQPMVYYQLQQRQQEFNQQLQEQQQFIPSGLGGVSQQNANIPNSGQQLLSGNFASTVESEAEAGQHEQMRKLFEWPN